MSGVSLHADHPVDALPDYVRGVAADPEAIERHLAECASCRVELEVLRALRESGPEPMTDLERERAYRGFESARAARVGSMGAVVHPSWLSATWRAAAAIAVLLTSAGLWRIARQPDPPDWNPELAIQGWERDLADLEFDPGEVRLAFGTSVEEPSWYEVEGLDPYEVAAPWEEER